MVLHRSNFEIPAQFSFEPFAATWQIASAETLEWTEEPKLIQMAFKKPLTKPEKSHILVRIEVPDEIEISAMLGAHTKKYDYVTLDRTSLPPDVLASHETHRSGADISGRLFHVLVCATEVESRRPVVSAGLTPKNAWLMRDEFLNLQAGSDWIRNLQRFLDKWGLWGWRQHITQGTLGKAYPNLSLLSGLPLYPRDVICLAPHSVKQQQESYSKALLPRNRRNWLRSHPLSLETVDEPPFFHVRKSYCSDAIETTITIDHLAERQFGICKRCHSTFEKETQHKREYCSRACINAANVQRWRAEQRKSQPKGAKRNAKG